MNTIELTPAQHAILAHAHQHTDGKITWFPDNVKGGARKKVLDGLFNRALITPMHDDWFITAEGYDALGVPRKGPMTQAEIDAIATQPTQVEDKPRSRENSKQAQVIAMLRRSEGATIAQICAATGWQAHTVRGTFAGALKKKLGMTIVSDKPQGGERIYRIS
ncbi:DUF3489 domain-containing protein [Thiomonas sp.]|uniref:DUF3489 domain-containing protein n=1 Tax=Thiomonas sp. TaxID=2047785 RepID=UPI002589AC0C|nr:DUF3489 domain-containing protein [Thiomonas sp.]